MADKDGDTLRQKLKAHLKRDDISQKDRLRFREELADPIIPPSGRRLWDWFWDISRDRVEHTALLSRSTIQAWSAVTGATPSQIELSVLTAMDDAYVAVVRADAPEVSETPEPASARAKAVADSFRTMIRARKANKRKRGGQDA